MIYNPKSKTLGVATKDLDYVYMCLIQAMKYIRKCTGLPMDKYKQEGSLSDADHAQRCILDAGKSIGIDMGAEWGNELDLRPEN